MGKIYLMMAALSAVVILSGCGHNAIQYGDGVGFDIGINPENCMLSMNLRYGKILSAVTRDNVELELTGNVAADGTQQSPPGSAILITLPCAEEAAPTGCPSYSPGLDFNLANHIRLQAWLLYFRVPLSGG